MRINPGVELRDNAGQLELVVTRHVGGPSEYETRYDDRVKIALAHAHLVADEDLLHAGPQWIADRLVDRFGAAPVNCYLGGIRAERIAMHGRSGDEHLTPQILFRLSVPATGAIAAAAISSQSGPGGGFLLQEVVATDADLAAGSAARRLRAWCYRGLGDEEPVLQVDHSALGPGPHRRGDPPGQQLRKPLSGLLAARPTLANWPASPESARRQRAYAAPAHRADRKRLHRWGNRWAPACQPAWSRRTRPSRTSASRRVIDRIADLAHRRRVAERLHRHSGSRSCR